VKWFEVRDPIYGFVTFNEWERDIINHWAFQRLRRIRQLGLTEMVYPGAAHTRFEHSLGVMHLATRMFDIVVEIGGSILKDRLDYEKSGLERDRQLVRLAALLHDLGHGPFSHTSEHIMPIIPGTQKHYDHEDYTCAVIETVMKDVIEENSFNKTNFGIKARDISALLKGDVNSIGQRVFWKTLISGQLDADRGDYLIRDSHHMGVKYGVCDIDRLLATLRVGIYVEQDEERVVIGIGEDGWRVAESLVIARYHIFPQVYLHKTRRAYDVMLTHALQEILKNGSLPPPNHIRRFLKWDDICAWRKFEANKKRNRWCRHIIARNHIRCVMEKPLHEEKAVRQCAQGLGRKGIEGFVDVAKKEWYKTKEDEIFVITEHEEAKPLSEFSRVIKTLSESESGTVRLFVWSQDKDNALDTICSLRY